jgi:osmotically inducible protein OsmC
LLDESNFSENYGIIGYSMKKEENDMKVLYTAVVTNTGGRSGKAYSSDGKFEVNVATPVEMGGKDPDATNPEQLFAAGYSSCFNGALELVLRKNRVRFESTQVAASVSLLEDPEDNGFKIAVHLQASVKGIGKEEAEKYVKLAHEICPYSKATRGNVEVTLEVVKS